MKPPIKKDAIFVSVASYRDEVCNSTLKSLFEMAKNPKNIFVGICQQNNPPEDGDCIESFEDNCNVKIIRIPHYEAKGPTYARYLCSTLWDGEEYFLQIDSHSKFVKDWDEKCINMIKQIKDLELSKKPVLSHYPREISEYESISNDEKQKTQVPRMCKSFFNNRGMISFMGSQTMDTKNIPYMTPYVAGGMCFSEAYFLDELPYDPSLPYLFVGEEILHSIRFYTNGWDIFTPTENIVFHEYTRANKPKIWTDNPYYSDIPAFEKVKKYINLVDKDYELPNELKNNLDKYGLGKTRSLDDYYKFAGIDIKNKTVHTNFCRENNIATEDDILNSNEKNHKTTETVTETVTENFDGGSSIQKRFGNKYLNIMISFVLFIFLLYLIYKIIMK